jgi:hypothetical protein
MTHKKMLPVKPEDCMFWARCQAIKKLFDLPSVLLQWLRRSWQVAVKGSLSSGKRALDY